MEQTRLRYGVSMLMAFLLTLVLTAVTGLLGLYLTVFNTKFLHYRLMEADYYQRVESYIYANMESLAIPFGIPATLLQGVVPTEKVALDVDNHLHQAWNGSDYVVDTSALEANLENRIVEFMLDKAIVITSRHEESVEEYLMLAVNEYEQNVRIPFIGAYVQINQYFKRLFPYALAACLVVTGLLSAVILKMYHRKSALVFFSYSFSATGLMSLLLPSVLQVTRFYERVQIAPQHFYGFVASMLERTFLFFIYLGLSWLALGAAAAFAGWQRRKRKRPTVTA